MSFLKLDKILPPAPPGTHVGILGGSFDPPHLCHQLLALSTLAIEPIEMLWIIPCADHPFQKKMTPIKDRIAMCKLAFGRLNKNVHVVPIEEYLPTPNYTARTLEIIHQLRPGIELYFTIGSDILPQITSWHEPEKLIQLCKIIIYLRDGFPVANIPQLLKNQIIHSGYTLPNIQSKYIRASLQTNQTMLDIKVKNYIKEHHLYQFDSEQLK